MTTRSPRTWVGLAALALGAWGCAPEAVPEARAGTDRSPRRLWLVYSIHNHGYVEPCG